MSVPTTHETTDQLDGLLSKKLRAHLAKAGLAPWARDEIQAELTGLRSEAARYRVRAREAERLALQAGETLATRTEELRATQRREAALLAGLDVRAADKLSGSSPQDYLADARELVAILRGGRR